MSLSIMESADLLSAGSMLKTVQKFDAPRGVDATEQGSSDILFPVKRARSS